MMTFELFEKSLFGRQFTFHNGTLTHKGESIVYIAKVTYEQIFNILHRKILPSKKYVTTNITV